MAGDFTVVEMINGTPESFDGFVCRRNISHTSKVGSGHDPGNGHIFTIGNGSLNTEMNIRKRLE
jgi:hypothetical protein